MVKTNKVNNILKELVDRGLINRSILDDAQRWIVFKGRFGLSPMYYGVKKE